MQPSGLPGSEVSAAPEGVSDGLGPSDSADGLVEPDDPD